jgi:excinuclease ABC subunit A
LDQKQQFIRIRGARQHNLKGIHLDIPRDQLVVITGLSGSGKSSLAFDTIYAEGQRRYVESLSAYARQFLEQMAKPDADHIEGLPPTIAIQQRAGTSNPRSTVATTTEIYDYLRLLYARVGDPHCCKCKKPITRESTSQIVDEVLEMSAGTRIMVLSPLVRNERGDHDEVLKRVRREGFVRVRINGEIHEVHRVPELSKKKKHCIEAVVDRLVVKPEIRVRLADSVDLATSMGGGLAVVTHMNGEDIWTDQLYSSFFACSKHPEVGLPELSPKLFSFNSPFGACPACDGLGTVLEFDEDLIVPDPDLSLSQGAIDAWRHGGKRMNIFYNKLLKEFCANFKISPEAPFRNVPQDVQRILIHGTNEEDQAKFEVSFEGVIPNLQRRWDNTDSEYVKQRLHAYLSELACESCDRARLRPEARAVLLGGKSIDEITRMNIHDALGFFSKLKLVKEKKVIAEQVLREIHHRLQFLEEVGVGYLTLERASATLSGGESQRIRLATQIGSGLVGVCYVLDEPTIGLHQRDSGKLIGTLRRLTDMGNSVLVVEHDEDTIHAADYLVDIGPGAGAHGGELVAAGTLKEVLTSTHSVTAKYLRREYEIPLPDKRRKVVKNHCIEIQGARENNLKNITVQFPLECFICVTGVSGSGKSSLVAQTLLPALRRRLHGSREHPGKHDKIIGASRIDKIVEIDQSPIGRTPRSNPSTYTGVFDQIRQLYAKTREAKIRGYTPGRFSFNIKGGRCEECQGQGTKKIEMHFLPDIYVDCDACKGARYNRDTLEIKYRGKSIADVLDMRVDESIVFFDGFSKIKQLLLALSDVGLGYMTLGQSSTTLSGGEAQRVKLASELGKNTTGHTLYVLDEPTTGLHIADIHNLLNVLNRLANMGNTILVIEHNLDVIKMADWIIDLGPEGGGGGGEIVAVGRPTDVAAHADSHTGRFLKPKLNLKAKETGS